MDEQYCPICNAATKYNPRYPNYVCNTCLAEGATIAGNLVPVSEIDIFFKPEILCIVKDIKCKAREAHFGGVVVQVI